MYLLALRIWKCCKLFSSNRSLLFQSWFRWGASFFFMKYKMAKLKSGRFVSHDVPLPIMVFFSLAIFEALLLNLLSFPLSKVADNLICRGYYTVARRYEFHFRVAKQYFTNERSKWVKYCFCHEKRKFISSSRRVMFFLLYRQTDIDKIIEGYDRNYVIYKLTCEIMENKPLGSLM